VLQKVLNDLIEHDVDALGKSRDLLPSRPLALDEVLSLLILEFHLVAHLLEADA
jgi:hypothetical protein